MRQIVVAGFLATALLGACSDGGAPADDAATTTTTRAGSTEAVEQTYDFSDDPDSAFCQRSRDAADQPVLDPFAPGLEPREVELRFRALTSRFRAFGEVAPEPLVEDLDLLVATFDRFAELLEAADYDFARLAETDVDPSVFDDPDLERVAARLAAYQEQVCQPA